MYFYKNMYVINKENVRLRQTIDFVVNQNSVTTWFVPLGRFSEQIDYDIRLVNTVFLMICTVLGAV